METFIYSKGDIIFKEGDRDRDYMYEVISGSVKAYADYGTESEILLTTLKAGDIFGEMALLEKAGRTATIVVEEDGTRLLCVDEASLREYLEDPDNYKKALGHMGHLIKVRSDDYIEACKTVFELSDAKKNRGPGLLDKIKKFVGASKKKDDVISAEKAWMDSGRVIMSDWDDAFADGKAVERAFDDGRVIFKEGETGDCMYYVTKGAVGIYSAYGTESERQLARLTPGMIFGEIGLLDRIPRTATAVAIEGGAVAKVVNEKYLTEVMPVLATQTLKYLSSRLRAVTNDYLRVCKTISDMESARSTGSTPDEETQKRIDEYVVQARAFLD